MTIEDIYRIEHELISEATMWERESAVECMRLGFYNEGIHDMAAAICIAMQKEGHHED